MLARFATEWPLLGCWGKRSDFVWGFRVEEMVTPKQLSYLHLVALVKVYRLRNPQMVT